MDVNGAKGDDVGSYQPRAESLGVIFKLLSDCMVAMFDT